MGFLKNLFKNKVERSLDEISELNSNILTDVIEMVNEEWKEIYLNASLDYDDGRPMLSWFFYFINEEGEAEQGLTFEQESLEYLRLKKEVQASFLLLGAELKKVSPVEIDYMNITFIVNEDMQFESVIEYEKDDSLDEDERRQLWKMKHMQEYEEYL